MPLDSKDLISLLQAIDSELPEKIRLNAVGGTALVLLNLKTATIDVDFDLNSQDHQILKTILERLQPGYRIDLFTDGFIFAQQLPDGYLKKCVKITTSQFSKIELYAISPIDVILSKTGRLNERDAQDIKLILAKFHISKRLLASRAKKIGYAGNQKIY